MRGWIQGYNAQAAVNEQQIVLAAEVMVASPDCGHLEPMINAAKTVHGSQFDSSSGPGDSR